MSLRVRTSQRTDSPGAVVVILQPLTGFLFPACSVVEPFPPCSCKEDPEERVPMREVDPGGGLRSGDCVEAPSTAGGERLQMRGIGGLLESCLQGDELRIIEVRNLDLLPTRDDEVRIPGETGAVGETPKGDEAGRGSLRTRWGTEEEAGT